MELISGGTDFQIASSSEVCFSDNAGSTIDDGEDCCTSNLSSHSHQSTSVSEAGGCSVVDPISGDACARNQFKYLQKGAAGIRRSKKMHKGPVSYASCYSRHGGVILGLKRRNRARQSGSSAHGLGLSVGMSMAAVIQQVLGKRQGAAEKISADHLSVICTSAVKESIANLTSWQLKG